MIVEFDFLFSNLYETVDLLIYLYELNVVYYTNFLINLSCLLKTEESKLYTGNILSFSFDIVLTFHLSNQLFYFTAL